MSIRRWDAAAVAAVGGQSQQQHSEPLEAQTRLHSSALSVSVGSLAS